MEMLFSSLMVILSMVALWKGADWLVDSAGRVGRKFGLSDVVIGLTIVAFGTSAPEFAVTIVAALNGQADISVGNIVGSNIFNVGFILGGVALAQAIPTTPRLVYRDGVMMLATTLLLYLVVFDQQMTLIEGIFFLALLGAYLVYLFNRGEEVDEEEIPTGEATWQDGLWLGIGLLLVVVGGHFLVEGASTMARSLGVSDWIIAVTIVAAGTSAPEVATSLAAVLKGRYGISIGNLIGSDIFNQLGVLGLAAVLNPNMVIDPIAGTSLLALIAMTVVALIFMRTDWKLARWEGAVLILIATVRWVMDFTMSTPPSV